MKKIVEDFDSDGQKNIFLGKERIAFMHMFVDKMLILCDITMK